MIFLYAFLSYALIGGIGQIIIHLIFWLARQLRKALRASKLPKLPKAIVMKTRAEEKQASRDADALALATGQKTREDLRRENGAFAFPRDRVKLTFPDRNRKF